MKALRCCMRPYVQSMSDYLRAKGDLYDVVVLCRHYIAIELS
jgi:hypothetical protein